MVDIQNATLAGGVGMGTVCNLVGVRPGGALVIGFVSGLVSCFGYSHVQEFLQNKINLHDTCGVFNLHGLPSIVGALAGVVVAALGDNKTYEGYLQDSFPSVFAHGRSFTDQAIEQLIAMLLTMLFAITGGIFTGALMSSKIFQPMNGSYFKDKAFWEVPASETPYFFDQNAEFHQETDVNKQEAIIKNLAIRLDMTESRLANVQKKDAASKLESIFEKVLSKMEKLQ